MQTMSSGYKDAVSASDRVVDVFISIGSGIDNTAADDITSVSGSFLPMSNTAQIVDAVYYITSGLATFEGDGIPTSPDAGIVAPPMKGIPYPPESGIWSAAISGADGTIEFEFTIALSKAHTSALRIYTDGPGVISATAEFDNGGTKTSKAFRCTSGYIEVADVMTYTAVKVAITEISEPYRHARIVECEFGASTTLSKSELGGEVVTIRESDPTEQTAPMDELDLSLVNVSGDFDSDKPSGRLDELKIGYPISLSFTVNGSDGRRWTVPCGRYYIAERNASDVRIDLVAFDARHLLSSLYTAWEIPADQSLGKTLDDLMTGYDVPHIVDASLYEVMPDAGYAFDDETALTDDLLMIQQAYGIYIIPDRLGSLKVTTQWPGGAYGSVPVASIYSWPTPQQTDRYNIVQVGYRVTEGQSVKTYYVQTDLRSDASESKSILQIGSNPLITTEARATEVMQRIVSRMTSDETETEWRGDPAMDLGDSVQMPGRWTQDAPLAYSIRRIEETYDGTYRATVRGAR